MRPDVGRPRVDGGVDVVEVPAEIAEEGLDEEVRTQLVESRDRLGDVTGAAVEEVVAVDHGEDHVLQLHLGDGAGHVLRLAHVDGAARIAGGDGAEAAAAGADVPQEHDRGGALAPALAHVGATRLLADRVQVERAEGLLQLRVAGATGGAHLQPGRLGGEAGNRGEPGAGGGTADTRME